MRYAMTPLIQFLAKEYMHWRHEGSLIFHNSIKQENGKTVITSEFKFLGPIHNTIISSLLKLHPS